MAPNDEKILEYWNRDDVESMYDKHLLSAEIELIKRRIPPNVKVLDAGCGEGEGTLVYCSVPNVTMHAVDFSATRLKKAALRLKGQRNVKLEQIDLLEEKHRLDRDYDVVVSQRFLINLTEWELQKQVLLDLVALLKSGGRLLMLEGSKQGVDSLNEFRVAWGLEPIPVKWHNLFFDDGKLINFMEEHGCNLLEQDGLGTYFLLTRGVRPHFDKELNWNSEFNRVAATTRMDDLLRLGPRFSRLKLWCFGK